MGTPLLSSSSASKSLVGAVADVPGVGAAPAPATDARRVGRVGLWALAIGFGGFLLWAGLAPLDEGVPAAGMVAIDTKRKAVQHLSGGIVQEVLVREGDEVQEGQALATVEAMKMENILKAEKKGVVKKINAAPGASLKVDDIIMEFE